MQFSKVKANAFQTLQMNAGILVDDFTPSTRTIGNILGATTGGLQYASNPTYVDFGEDVDNAPANTKQLKMLQYIDPVISGTFISMDGDLAAKLAGGGTYNSTTGLITPPSAGLVANSAFSDLWMIGDYSDSNEQGSTAAAGFVAIHIKDALNTVGFQWTTTKDGKGQFAFEYHGHYDIENIDDLPLEIYVLAGTDGDAQPSIRLNQQVITIADESTYQLTAYTVPAGATVTWASGATGTATVSNGLVTGKQAGNTIITASITQGGVTYSATCTVIVTA